MKTIDLSSYTSIKIGPIVDVEIIQNPLHVEIEKLSKEDLVTEKIFLGLRSIVGIDLKILNQKQLEKVQTLLDEKKLTCKDNFVYNNDFLIADEIALYIIA